jgi:hypothetical protein
MRYIVFALVAVLFSSVAHAQQGNLPKPVGKLPPYPPVVCVTPIGRQNLAQIDNHHRPMKIDGSTSVTM